MKKIAPEARPIMLVFSDDGTRIILPNPKGDTITSNDWIVVQGLQMARINYPVEPIKPSTTQPAQSVSSAQ